jgi:zinc transporter 1
MGNYTSAVQGKSKSNSARETESSNKIRRTSSSAKSKGHRRSRSRGYSSLDEIYVYPSSFRNSIIESSRAEASETDSDQDAETAVVEEEPSEQSPLLRKSGGISSVDPVASPKKQRDYHSKHNHSKPKEGGKHGGHGHSHGDLNMRGVFLHVLGDALGNVGVIASALIIWLTDFSWRFYSDPLISLIITVIILCSAIPLCKAASRILLQAVPAGLSIDDIREDINALGGVVSCHHVHVWQLSDSKLVASLHVQVDFDFKGSGSAQYMDLAREIRKCLHEYGIHSSTIQPEFCLDANHDHSGITDESSSDEGHASRSSSRNGAGSKTGSIPADADACLLECSEACGNSKQCCNPSTTGCAANGR